MYRQKLYLCIRFEKAPRGGAVVARWAHNPKAGGSIPSPATKTTIWSSFFCVNPSEGVVIFSFCIFITNYC